MMRMMMRFGMIMMVLLSLLWLKGGLLGIAEGVGSFGQEGK